MMCLAVEEVLIRRTTTGKAKVIPEGGVLIPISSIVAVEEPAEAKYAGLGLSFVYVGWRRYLVNTPFGELQKLLEEGEGHDDDN